jgi:hypothetical protein
LGCSSTGLDERGSNDRRCLHLPIKTRATLKTMVQISQAVEIEQVFMTTWDCGQGAACQHRRVGSQNWQ